MSYFGELKIENGVGGNSSLRRDSKYYISQDLSQKDREVLLAGIVIIKRLKISRKHETPFYLKVLEKELKESIGIENEKELKFYENFKEINENLDAIEKEKKQLQQQRQQQMQQKLEQEKMEKKKLEQEKLELQKIEKEKIEKEKREQEKLEQEKLEQQKLEQEKLEQQKLEQQKLEQEKLEQEKLELKKQELQKIEIEKEKIEKEKLEQEKLEQQRLEQQKQELKEVKRRAELEKKEVINDKENEEKVESAEEELAENVSEKEAEMPIKEKEEIKSNNQVVDLPKVDADNSAGSNKLTAEELESGLKEVMNSEQSLLEYLDTFDGIQDLENFHSTQELKVVIKNVLEELENVKISDKETIGQALSKIIESGGLRDKVKRIFLHSAIKKQV